MSTHAPPKYKPLDVLASKLTILWWLEIAISVSNEILDFSRGAEHLASINGALLLSVLVLSIVNTFLFLKWLNYAYSNLENYFNLEGLSGTSKQAVLSWLIPIRNWWVPYRYMRDLWQASDPRNVSENWRKSSVPSEMRWWWCFWVCWWMFSGYGTGIDLARETQQTASDGRLWPYDVATFCWVLFILLQIRFVTAISWRQHQKHHQESTALGAAIHADEPGTPNDGVRINLAEVVIKDTAAEPEYNG